MKNMKRKGFTLIELLAVIVILAVIALITVPMIINVIEKAKRQSFIDSAYGIIEAGEIGDDLIKDGTPIGMIMSYMTGSTAPEGYLACDGSIYNISKYPNLANAIKEGFGSYNHYGGDGETTFAVPDLRGEFLRRTGSNGHENQGFGEELGTHQDAPEHLYFHSDAQRFYIANISSSREQSMKADFMGPSNVTLKGVASTASAPN